jgi:hypothetical protein
MFVCIHVTEDTCAFAFHMQMAIHPSGGAPAAATTFGSACEGSRACGEVPVLARLVASPLITVTTASAEVTVAVPVAAATGVGGSCHPSSSTAASTLILTVSDSAMPAGFNLQVKASGRKPLRSIFKAVSAETSKRLRQPPFLLSFTTALGTLPRGICMPYTHAVPRVYGHMLCM